MPGKVSASRVTNGRSLFIDKVDGRNAAARRFRDIYGELLAGLGGLDATNEAQRQLVRRAAAMSVQAEQLDARLPKPQTSGNRSKGRFVKQDFRYVAEEDVYICPAGERLRYYFTTEENGLALRRYWTNACPACPIKEHCTTGKQRRIILSDDTRRYLASTRDCGICPLKQRCCPNMTFRKIPRDINESARDYVRSLAGTEPFERSRRERKKVEMLFAHLKRHMGFERMRLRGLSGANDEFLLAATAQNLKRLAKLAAEPPTRVPKAA